MRDIHVFEIPRLILVLNVLWKMRFINLPVWANYVVLDTELLSDRQTSLSG